MQTFGFSFRLDEKIALVVGAGSGIGRAAALGLAAYGATVVCAGVNQNNLIEVVNEIIANGGQAGYLTIDITRSDSVNAGLDKILATYHRIDVLVSTPAMNLRKPFLAYSDDEVDQIIDLNLKGQFRVLRGVGSIMSTNGVGSIIVLSSIRSLVVEPGQSVYAATKAGVVQLARGLASELGHRGVRVNAIAPGIVDTPLTRPIRQNPEWREAYAAKTALGRWARVEELIGPIVFLASDASSYVTGTVLFVDGGWTAIDGRFQPPI